MNTSAQAMTMDEERPRPARVAPHATHKFKLLLKREFWEHKGGFFWAPIWAGGISLVLTLMALVVAEVAGRRAVASGKMQIDGDVNINGLDLSALTSKMDAGDLQKLAGGIDISTVMSSLWPMIVLAFVVFFYALGCLYDDRRDRSILFWKSLPVSDSQMVLSKLAWALVLAPVLAVAIGLLIGLALWLISALTITVNGVPAAHAVFTQSHPLRIIGGVLACLPVYMAWALPTIGWLMFCSAAARSKPFLWAVLVPVLACVVISMTTILPGVDIAHDRVWYTLAYRGLLSAVPGAWFPTISGVVDTSGAINTPDDLAGAINLARSWQAFASADLWIGAVVGIALIAAAIRLRRWRDEG